MLNIAKNFNNEDISDISVSIILAVCSIMDRKGNHWILYLMLIGQYGFLSWKLINFLSEGLFTLASIIFSYAEESILIFHSCTNGGWLISFDKGSKYVLNVLLILSSLPLYIVWI